MFALCPHCLEYRDLQPARDPELGPVLRCDSARCNDPTIPLLYGEDYDSHPPVPLSILGLPGHGKTAFIDGLIREIPAAGLRWADTGFTYAWLDENRMREICKRIRAHRDGRYSVDEGHSLIPTPQVLRLHGVPCIGGSQLVISDSAVFVRSSSVVVWLLCLNQGNPEDVCRTMTACLQATSGLGRHQTLVLVLTKGDELLRRPDLPGSARAALAEVNYSPRDPVWTTLDRASTDLEAWLASDRCGYRSLVDHVQSRFQSVRYCVVSALEESLRYGVLVPLLWLWRLGRDPVWVERGGHKDLYLDLSEAIATAETIHLDARVYQLNSPLNVLRPVTIIGRGPGQTVLEVSASGYGLGIRTVGKVTLRGLTIRRKTDGSPGDLIRALGGELELRDVVVSHGLSGDVAGKPVNGAGLLVGQHARLTAVACEFRSNHGNGVLVNERASAELTSCLFEKNGAAGLYARTAGVLTLTQGICRENHTGFWVEAASGAVITANVLEQNVECGVVLSGHICGSVVVRGNTSMTNGRDGIHVRTAAAPTVVGNTCTANHRHGIAFTDRSAGTARGNTCANNDRHGLRICDEASPGLEANTTEGNAQCGIFYEEQAAGFSQGNDCHDNHGDGIRLEGSAAPLLAENESRRNGGYGIAIIAPTSQVELDPNGNTTEENRQGQILDSRPKKRDSWWGWKI